MDNGGHIGVGDLGQDMGLWTVGVTGDRTWDCGYGGDIGTGDLG